MNAELTKRLIDDTSTNDLETTLWELFDVVRSVSADDHEAEAVVWRMLRTGRVRLHAEGVSLGGGA